MRQFNFSRNAFSASDLDSCYIINLKTVAEKLTFKFFGVIISF